MSGRGGRGRGRGGRGGGRGGRPDVPWDTGDEPDARPSELFPPYDVPTPRDLTPTESRSIQHHLLLRRQFHASPLYTSRRTLLADPTAPRKMYGQDQVNAAAAAAAAANTVRKAANANAAAAAVDPFTSMPTYSQKFVPQERALPDWSGRPICRELFPAELLATIDPDGAGAGAAPAKKRRLELSSVSALPNAEEAFGMPALPGADAARDAAGGGGGGGGEGQGGQTLLDKLEALRDEDGDEGDGDDEEGLNDEDEDEIYDDEDAGDYDAEQFFDNGEDFGDEYGDGDDGGEGTY